MELHVTRAVDGDQGQVAVSIVSIYTHFSDIRIIPVVVQYHPISDGVSVGFTGRLSG